MFSELQNKTDHAYATKYICLENMDKNVNAFHIIRGIHYVTEKHDINASAFGYLYECETENVLKIY